MKTMPNVTYTSELKSDCDGTLTIRGVHMPKTEKIYDPFAKIWAKIRKVFTEKYGVNVCATFHYKEEITCNFYVDNAYGEYHKLSQDVLRARFKQAWPFIIADFEDILEAYFGDIENGYLKYVEIMKSLDIIGEAKARIMCNTVTTVFLKTVNLNAKRKPSKYSSEERAIIQKARAERKARKKIKKRVGATRKGLLQEYQNADPITIRQLAIEQTIAEMEREELARRNTQDELIAWSIEELFERA